MPLELPGRAPRPGTWSSTSSSAPTLETIARSVVGVLTAPPSRAGSSCRLIGWTSRCGFVSVRLLTLGLPAVSTSVSFTAGGRRDRERAFGVPSLFSSGADFDARPRRLAGSGPSALVAESVGAGVGFDARPRRLLGVRSSAPVAGDFDAAVRNRGAVDPAEAGLAAGAREARGEPGTDRS